MSWKRNFQSADEKSALAPPQSAFANIQTVLCMAGAIDTTAFISMLTILWSEISGKKVTCTSSGISDKTKSSMYCLRVGSVTSCFSQASLQIFHKRSPTAVLECEWWSHRWWWMVTSPTKRIPITSACNLQISAASPSRELPSSSRGLYQFPNRIVPKFVSRAHHIRSAPSSYSSRAMFVKEDLANMAMPPNPHFGPMGAAPDEPGAPSCSEVKRRRH